MNVLCFSAHWESYDENEDEKEDEHPTHLVMHHF